MKVETTETGNATDPPKDFTIAVGKLHYGKASGRDLFVASWHKRFTFYRKLLASIFNNIVEGHIDIPM